MKKDSCFAANWLIRIIVGLVIIMLILVVHDRYVFHAKVYRNAVSEVYEFEKTKKARPFSFKCRHHKNSITISPYICPKMQAENTDSIHQTIYDNSTSYSLNNFLEERFSLFSLMKDVDGLISANGLTFLISLIVALLIALVTDRLGTMEKLSAQVETEFESNKKLKEETNNVFESNKRVLEDNNKLSTLLQQSFEETKKKTASLYNHLANNNRLLVRVESLYNLAITIGTITRFLPLAQPPNKKEKKSLPNEVGVLCSRLSLSCDLIEDILNDRERKIDYLSEDDKNILLTYISEAKDELERSRITITNNIHLNNIIIKIRCRLENINDLIKAMEEKPTYVNSIRQFSVDL